ncbi:AraC family transcriptional regulator [Pelagibius sp. CAU 1746]|uniref:AraC family transcriptional regulator n=1 Tax=Pelagibius sp. CAU 1746 TaxID=3140370 RepID=UPI00325BA883
MSEETRQSSEVPTPEATAPEITASGASEAFPWLTRRSLSASVFFSGPLCGAADYPDDGPQGHLHLVQRGPVTLHAAGSAPQRIESPSLILFARPCRHRLETEEQAGADLVCARLTFEGPEADLLLLGFPERLVIALDDLEGLEPVLNRLFDEAFNRTFGQEAAVDLLIELLMVMLLRHCVTRGLTQSGLLAGLADPKLARALAAMHQAPEDDLPLERLAAIAGMSRSTFAAAFKARVGLSPGDYLTTLRMTVARQELLAGRPLKAVAAEAGYRSPTALARAFQRQFGCGPREWLAQQR